MDWTCNGCEQTGRTSREHFIHVAIGRVILGNSTLSTEEVRRFLRSGHFAEYRQFSRDLTRGIDADEGPARLDTTIRGLLCASCNQTWARRLEEDAGRNLYDFTMNRGRADAAVLRRWAWFFAMKLWFTHARTEFLADGPLAPVLPKLATPGVDIQMPVRVAVMDASPNTWRFAAMRGWSGKPDPFMAWVMRGIVWMVVASQRPTLRLPIPTVELTDGLRAMDAPRVGRKGLIRVIGSPPARFGPRAPD